MVKSALQHNFARVPSASIQRSVFDRSHGHKTTFNAGYLIPVLVDEALPGDTFTCDMTAFARFATPIFPIMDNLFLDSFFFFVPNRLLWSHWEQFNGQQANPTDSTSFLVPTMTAPGAGGVATGDLSDYFGIPIKVNSLVFNSLHHRAYNLIWNEWFRDQNLQNSVTVDLGDGPDTYTNYVLLRRGKRHDYFTSSLPWPQKGPSVSLPLGTQAPVRGLGVITGTANTTTSSAALDSGGASIPIGTRYYSPATATFVGPLDAVNSAGSVGTGGHQPNVYADLTAATAATINQLRQSFQIQKLYERDARGGTRYTEILRSHFGVVSPDARLQRPEYLGGGSSPINITPIVQNSATGLTGGSTPQGNLAAIGTVTAHRHGFTKSFTEHGVIIGMVSVRADLNYQQGLNRMWNRQTRWDFYWPALSHIGEQSVLNKEIYSDGSANDTAVFGYQERYAEYRYKPSVISGLFRSTATTPLDSWHLAEDFLSLPALNSSFIQVNPPITRVIAVTSQPAFIFDSVFRLKSARPMPVFGVPGLIDHF